MTGTKTPGADGNAFDSYVTVTSSSVTQSIDTTGFAAIFATYQSDFEFDITWNVTTTDYSGTEITSAT